MGRYQVLEEMALADCALAIEGDDLDDLFETAAAALGEMMVDPTTLPITVEHTVRLTAPALDLLFYDWLSELIYRKDRDREVFTRTEVQVNPSSPCQLTARLYGGVIDPERTALGIDLKAVTFHEFTMHSVDGAWRAQVVIDV